MSRVLQLLKTAALKTTADKFAIRFRDWYFQPGGDKGGQGGAGPEAVGSPSEDRRAAQQPVANPEWETIRRMGAMAGEGSGAGNERKHRSSRSGDTAGGRFDLRPLVFLGVVVGLLSLSRIGAHWSTQTASETRTYYSAVFSPGGDSVAYLKRTARFTSTPQKMGLVPGYLFESDRLELCVFALSGGDETCLGAWALPPRKRSRRSGVIDPAINWEAEGLRFDIWLKDFIWDGAESRRAPRDPASNSSSESPFAEQNRELWHRIQGVVRNGRVRSMGRQMVREGATAIQNTSRPFGPQARRLEQGITRKGGLMVRATPPLEGRSVLRPNRLDISAYEERQSREREDNPFQQDFFQQRFPAPGRPSPGLPLPGRSAPRRFTPAPEQE